MQMMGPLLHMFSHNSPRERHLRFQASVGKELFDDRYIGIVPACETGAAEANTDAPFSHGFRLVLCVFRAIKIVIVIYITAKNH